MTIVSLYLGMNLSHNLETHEIIISCEKYFDKMAKRYKVMTTAQQVHTL